VVLPSGQSTIDRKGDSIYKGGFIGGQKDEGVRHIIHRGQPSERDFPEALGPALGILQDAAD
jgi:hypothetical protein